MRGRAGCRYAPLSTIGSGIEVVPVVGNRIYQFQKGSRNLMSGCLILSDTSDSVPTILEVLTSRLAQLSSAISGYNILQS